MSEPVYLPKIISEHLRISRSEARRVIAQGGVKVDGVIVSAFDIDPKMVEGKQIKVGKTREFSPPANSPKREREGEMCEAAYRCVNPECGRPWIVFAVHGEPTDGIDDPRVCRFCGAGEARRVR